MEFSQIQYCWPKWPKTKSFLRSIVKEVEILWKSYKSFLYVDLLSLTIVGGSDEELCRPVVAVVGQHGCSGKVVTNRTDKIHKYNYNDKNTKTCHLVGFANHRRKTTLHQRSPLSTWNLVTNLLILFLFITGKFFIFQRWEARPTLSFRYHQDQKEQGRADGEETKSRRLLPAIKELNPWLRQETEVRAHRRSRGLSQGSHSGVICPVFFYCRQTLLNMACLTWLKWPILCNATP